MEDFEKWSKLYTWLPGKHLVMELQHQDSEHVLKVVST